MKPEPFAVLSDQLLGSETPPPRDESLSLRQAEIQAAFREGYDDGYRNGQDDYGTFEWGGGSKHPNVQKRDKDESWKESDAKARLLK